MGRTKQIPGQYQAQEWILTWRQQFPKKNKKKTFKKRITTSIKAKLYCQKVGQTTINTCRLSEPNKSLKKIVYE